MLNEDTQDALWAVGSTVKCVNMYTGQKVPVKLLYGGKDTQFFCRRCGIVLDEKGLANLCKNHENFRQGMTPNPNWVRVAFEIKTCDNPNLKSCT